MSPQINHRCFASKEEQPTLLPKVQLRAQAHVLAMAQPHEIAWECLLFPVLRTASYNTFQKLAQEQTGTPEENMLIPFIEELFDIELVLSRGPYEVTVTQVGFFQVLFGQFFRKNIDLTKKKY